MSLWKNLQVLITKKFTLFADNISVIAGGNNCTMIKHRKNITISNRTYTPSFQKNKLWRGSCNNFQFFPTSPFLGAS